MNKQKHWEGKNFVVFFWLVPLVCFFSVVFRYLHHIILSIFHINRTRSRSEKREKITLFFIDFAAAVVFCCSRALCINLISVQPSTKYVYIFLHTKSFECSRTYTKRYRYYDQTYGRFIVFAVLRSFFGASVANKWTRKKKHWAHDRQE